MADDKEVAETPAEAPTGGKPKLVVLLGLVAAGLGSGGAVGAFVAGPMAAKKFAPIPISAADSARRADSLAKAAEHGPKGKDGDAGASYLLDNMVLNPAGSGGGRYLLASVSLRYADATLKETMTARESELRDVILNVLGTKGVEQLSEVAGRDALKDEIRAKVDSLLGKKAVTGVFFPQFVIQ